MADDPDAASAPADADGSDAASDSAESPDRPALPADPLLAWALGGFHAALLVAVGVLALHAAGSAGDLLQGLSTAAGLAAYLGLGATAWWTARGWLRDGGAPLDAIKWGSANALVVFAAGFLVVFAPLAVRGASLAFLAIALVGGAAVAVTIGALVGGILGLLDHALLRIGWRFVG